MTTMQPREHPANQPRTSWLTRLEAAAALVADRGAAGADPGIEGHPAVALLGGRDGALAYLHSRWVTYFGVALDQELEHQPETIPDAAWRAWRHVGQQHPGLARILSHYGQADVVCRADEHHHRLLSQAAGCDHQMLPDFAGAGRERARPPLALIG